MVVLGFFVVRSSLDRPEISCDQTIKNPAIETGSKGTWETHERTAIVSEQLEFS